MLGENYAIDLKQLSSLIAQLTSNKIDQGLVEDFNNSYELGIDIHSPRSLYQLAEGIQRRVKKQFSLEPGFTKAKLMNIWHLGEKTLFFCTLIYYLSLKKISIQSIREKELLALQKIFVTKDISLLLFEAKHLFCYGPMSKGQWSEECVELFREIMMSKKEDFRRNEKCFRWKEVSFEIFKQSRTGEFHSAKDCRQKWVNHFNPQLLKKTWTLKEDIELFTAIAQFGRKWALISKKTGGMRTEHMVKNRANSLLKRFLKKKVKKLENSHITFVIASLQDQECLIQTVKQEAISSSYQVKKQESKQQSESFIQQDQVKLEMEDISDEDRNKQFITLELQESCKDLVMQSVKQQCLWNEEGHFFNYFDTNKLKQQPNEEHLSQ